MLTFHSFKIGKNIKITLYPADMFKANKKNASKKSDKTAFGCLNEKSFGASYVLIVKFKQV